MKMIWISIIYNGQ